MILRSEAMAWEARERVVLGGTSGFGLYRWHEVQELGDLDSWGSGGGRRVVGTLDPQDTMA